MAKCDTCGKHENMPYNCRHCGGTFCAEHRLPENHDCPGLEDWGDPDSVFSSGFDESVNTGTGGTSGGLASRLGLETGRGGFLGYVRGNMTFVFLGLMWVTFFLQFVVFPLAGYGPRTQLWETVFVLTPQHPEYVWTWFTSIFAHGGFGHIALNSIVIYFFGRLVEDYVGSRDFTLLFLASGALAGLSQIALTIVQGPVTPFTPGVVGASGAGLAIMGVLTILNPGLRVYLYFVVPVPIWAVTAFYAVISILGIVGTGGSILGGNVANMAHLVGLLIGLAYGQRVKGRVRTPNQFNLGGGRGPGGPGGPGGRF